MSDESFDKMCKWMLSSYEKLDHINKELVTKDMLEAGSGYSLKEADYPLRVKLISDEFIREYYKHRDGND